MNALKVSDGNGGQRISKTKITAALGALAVVGGQAAGIPETIMNPIAELMLFGVGFFLRG